MSQPRVKRRHKARELALKGLYAWEISGNSKEDVYQFLKNQEDGQNEDIIEFAWDLLVKTVENKDTFDKDIAGMAKNWDLERIAIIDRFILRLAICELTEFEEIPPKVTINEAIDLAKAYSTAESGRFVNGILDSLYQKLKSEKRIVKKGRGLIET